MILVFMGSKAYGNTTEIEEVDLECQWIVDSSSSPKLIGERNKVSILIRNNGVYLYNHLYPFDGENNDRLPKYREVPISRRAKLSPEKVILEQTSGGSSEIHVISRVSLDIKYELHLDRSYSERTDEFKSGSGNCRIAPLEGRRF